jgi:hypothetical protein
MFADLDDTIRQLLIEHVPLDLSEIDVSFEAPDREWSGRLSRPTVNCFLYDVHENLEFRHQVDWDVQTNKNGTATLRQMPAHLDVTYHVTAWARAPEDEHQLLWRVLTALFRNKTVPDGVLRGELREQAFPLRAQVAQQSQSRSNPAELWQALDNRIRPALTYTLALPLDPQVAHTEPLVFSRATRIHPPEEHAPTPRLRIGGHVHQNGAPLRDTSVTIRETGSATITDAQGRYALLAHLGTQTLVLGVPGDKPTAHRISVPSATYDIDL